MKNKPSYEILEEEVKALKSELEFKNTLIKMVFDTVPYPVFFKDKDGIYQNCNDAFSKTILGISKEEIIGKSLYELPDLIPKELADIYYEKDRILLANSGTQEYEGEVRCADGLVRTYNFYKATFLSDSKEILGIVGSMLDVSDYKKALQSLNDMSITDSLTQLYNRRHFETIFSKKFAAVNRDKVKFAFVMLDIDFFKDYNDNFGHHYGDTALKKIAQNLKNHFSRTNDYVFRLGGEEFGVIFNFNERKEALLNVKKVIKSVENLKIKASKKDVSQFVTISAGLGVVEYFSKEDCKPEHLYDKVDKLLYNSKLNGRNQLTYKIFDEYD